MSGTGPSKAGEFVREWSSPFPIVLTAIDPDSGAITTAGFASGGREAASDFIARFNGKRGLYFSVNGDLRSPLTIATKAKKSDISHALAAHIDVDVYKTAGADKAKILADLKKGQGRAPGPPSLIVNSGNGFQAFWRLKTPYVIGRSDSRLALVEGINRRLADQYRGDSTHDITRIMRVPYTINLPNKAKRALGLEPVASAIVHRDDTRCYDVAEFEVEALAARPRRQVAQVHIGPAETVEDVDDLIVSERTKLLIVLGTCPGVQRPSRSEWLFSAIISLIRAGESDEVILGVVTDARWAISESVLDKPDPDQHGRRQIRRAHAWLSDQIRKDFEND